MGLRFAGGIVLFVVGGLFLDRWLGTSPLFILVGTLVGAVLSFVSVYRELVSDKANRPSWRPRGGAKREGGGQP
jgi:F0F1-type ATP synthase assembly protein I